MDLNATLVPDIICTSIFLLGYSTTGSLHWCDTPEMMVVIDLRSYYSTLTIHEDRHSVADDKDKLLLGITGPALDNVLS